MSKTSALAILDKIKQRKVEENDRSKCAHIRSINISSIMTCCKENLLISVNIKKMISICRMKIAL